MRLSTAIVGTALTATAVLALATTPAEGSQDARTPQHGAVRPAAYFSFEVGRSKDSRKIFKLTDPAKIKQARDIVSGREKENIHVMGKIVKSPAPYNPEWSYHLDPQTIRFFGFAMEVCDASAIYVESHLAEVGGELLPGSFWCPWSSRVLREIPAYRFARSA